MRGIVWHAAMDLRLEDVPDPEPPRNGEALVEVSYCGICGTDLHEYQAGPKLIRTGPHPLTGEAPPLILGHEFSGRVVALGSPVDGVAIGDRVTVDPCWRCGVCFWCTRGEYHICRIGGAVGLASNGGLARHVRVPAAGLVKLPDEVPDRLGALVEPLAVGLHAIDRAQLSLGETVLIFGFGPIGAAVLLAASAAGASAVYVSEPAARRREMALQMGATEAFDPGHVDVRREVFTRTGRIGPDVVVDCTGVPRLLGAAVAASRRGGRVVTCSVNQGEAALPTNDLVLYERTLAGSLGYNHDLERVVSLMAAGRLPAEALITDIVSLDEAIPGAFGTLSEGRAEHLKILVRVEE